MVQRNFFGWMAFFSYKLRLLALVIKLKYRGTKYSIGKNLRIDGGVGFDIGVNSRVMIGDNVIMETGSFFFFGANSTVLIGNNSW